MRCHDDHHQKECHHDYCWFSSYFADSNRDPWRILSFWFLLQNWPNISPEVILDTRNIKNRPLIDKQFMGIKHSLSRNCTEIKLSFASKCAVEDDTSSITTSASSLCLLPVVATAGVLRKEAPRSISSNSQASRRPSLCLYLYLCLCLSRDSRYSAGVLQPPSFSQSAKRPTQETHAAVGYLSLHSLFSSLS